MVCSGLLVAASCWFVADHLLFVADACFFSGLLVAGRCWFVADHLSLVAD